MVCEAARGGREVMVQLARHWGAKVLALAHSPDDTGLLDSDPAVSQLLDISPGCTPFIPACMEATAGIGADCIIGGGGAAGPTKSEIITCLAVGGRWVCTDSKLTLDPADSELLFAKGASVCYLNEDVWTLSGSQLGRYMHILDDLMAKIASGIVTPRRLERLSELDNVVAMLSHPEGVGKYVYVAS